MRSGPSMAATSRNTRRQRKRKGGPSGISASVSIGSGHSSRRSGRLGAAATALCLAAALVLKSWLPPSTLPLFLGEVALWGCLVVLPLVYSALPAGLKRAARARLRPASPGA